MQTESLQRSITLFILLAVAPGAIRAQEWQAVAVKGSPASGEDRDFSFFKVAALNSAGQVAFTAALDGSRRGLGDIWTIWAGAPGDLEVLARSQDHAPGTDARFRLFDEHSIDINADGQVLFKALLEGPNIKEQNESGVWVGAPGDLQLLARQGMVDHASKMTIAQTLQMALANDRNVALLANTQTGYPAIWMGPPGNLRLLAQSQSPAPGTDRKFAPYPFSLVTTNEKGQIAFVGTFDGDPPGGGLWIGTSASIKPVILSPATAPGFEPGWEMTVLEGVQLNDRGQFVCQAGLVKSPEVMQSIWIGDADASNLKMIANTKIQPPDHPAGVTFYHFQPPRIDAQGGVVFQADVQGPGVDYSANNALFLFRDGRLKLIARQGGDAPGLAAGVQFRDLGKYHMNSVGQVLFNANLRGPGINKNEGGTMWIQDLEGPPRLILQLGKSLPGSGSVTRCEIHRSPERTSFNDRGEVAAHITFSPSGQVSEGIYLFSAETIPTNSPGLSLTFAAYALAVVVVVLMLGVGGWYFWKTLR